MFGESSAPWSRTAVGWICLLSACASPPEEARCTLTDGRATCTHETTTLHPHNVDRDVHWQLPLGDPPPEGFPVVLLFQGSMVPADATWSAREGAPLGAFHQVSLVAALLDGGFAVLAPEALGWGLTCWNTNVPPWADAWEGAPDDLLMLDLFDHIEDGTFGPLDPDRLHAVGISSGGYMTSRMAVSYPGRFESLVIASASFATCAGFACDVPDVLPADHPPTRFLHGALDPVVPMFTMERYRDALLLADVPVDTVIDDDTGHAWFSAAPVATLAWFEG
ncbi:MAG: plasmid partitioning protein [Alphaproteobacteria bacterium]|nr:plasmid partitioning protein [Alphaproteobacteria bacterium]